jgi:hypothetical protein
MIIVVHCSASLSFFLSFFLYFFLSFFLSQVFFCFSILVLVLTIYYYRIFIFIFIYLFVISPIPLCILCGNFDIFDHVSAVFLAITRHVWFHSVLSFCLSFLSLWFIYLLFFVSAGHYVLVLWRWIDVWGHCFSKTLLVHLTTICDIFIEISQSRNKQANWK